MADICTLPTKDTHRQPQLLWDWKQIKPNGIYFQKDLITNQIGQSAPDTK